MHVIQKLHANANCVELSLSSASPFYLADFSDIFESFQTFSKVNVKLHVRSGSLSATVGLYSFGR